MKHEDLTKQIIGAYFSVYGELGYGFLERVYRDSMVIQLEELSVPVKSEQPIEVWFHKQKVGDYRADLVVDGRVLVELKSAKALAPEHEAQLLNYLRATRYEVGLLRNFGPEPTFKRKVFDNDRKGGIEPSP